jgi:hypothetical protein
MGMIPKKGDLTFYKNPRVDAKAITLYGSDMDLSIGDERLATREDLASMELVTQAEYDALQRKHNSLVSDWNKLHQIEGAYMEPAPTEPQPHVWQVGDYMLCPDGKVRRVTKVWSRPELCSKTQFFELHDGGHFPLGFKLTLVPEPPMPDELFKSGLFFLECDRLKYYTGTVMSLKAWIAACEADKEQWAESTLKMLLALSEWRKLTGREV